MIIWQRSRRNWISFEMFVMILKPNGKRPLLKGLCYILPYSWCWKIFSTFISFLPKIMQIHLKSKKEKNSYVYFGLSIIAIFSNYQIHVTEAKLLILWVFVGRPTPNHPTPIYHPLPHTHTVPSPPPLDKTPRIHTQTHTMDSITPKGWNIYKTIIKTGGLKIFFKSSI